MPFTQFTNLDFDQIRTSIKDYLRANSNFTDFDFEGSNFSILIDTLAYNTYITAFNSNMIVNESFLDSATIRENVVSLARNIGYVPYSRKSADAEISFSVNVSPTQTNPIQYSPTITLEAGLVCTGEANNSSFVFSIPENVTATVNSNGVAQFSSVKINQGTFITKQFVFNGSLNQKFILDNPYVDVSTIRVYVKGLNDTGYGKSYILVENIFNVDPNSEIFLLQEIKDEKYQILFGDGIFGKKLENNAVITVTYIVTEGKSGNGSQSFSFAGSLKDSSDNVVIPTNSIAINTIRGSENGSDIESIDSIKYFAPRLYSSQYRAVTPKDYESIIKSKIYPNAEAVSVIGGEELDPPQFGKVLISIKPKNGSFVSDFDKQQIKRKLKQYSISGIDSEITDLKYLYVEIDSSIYYNNSQVGNVEDLKTRIINSLTTYSQSPNLSSFGGRFKYSKLLQVIDNTDRSITSNITKVRIRRDLKALINIPTQYELCFGNKFHINPLGRNIKSTGFNILGEPGLVYLTDTPIQGTKNGTISIVREIPIVSNNKTELDISIVVQSAGTVNYETGEILLSPLIITSTDLDNQIIEVQAFPESNDIIGLKDLYLSFSISKSKINMIRDVIASGDDTSGVLFSKPDYYRSSYSNGDLKRL